MLLYESRCFLPVIGLLLFTWISCVYAITDVDVSENIANDDNAIPQFENILPEDSNEVTLSTAEVGVARYLGLGYDLMRANPFATTLDPGLKSSSLKPAKLLKTFFQNNATCPQLTQCLKIEPSVGTDGPAKDQQLFIRSFADYQRATLEHLHVYGKFTSNITNAVGTAENSLDTLRNQLASGASFTAAVSFRISEEAELDFRSSQTLHTPFAIALCELPLDYQRDEYLSLLKEFGTHVIVKIRLAKTVVRRVTITPEMLYQSFVDSGVSVDTINDGYFLANITGTLMARIAQNVEKNGSLTSLVDVSTMSEASPVVTAIREIPYFVTRERLQRSGASIDNCRHLIQDAPDGTAASKVAQLRENLGRALIDYAGESKHRLHIKQPEFFFWPPEIYARIAFTQSRSLEFMPDGCTGSVDLSLLGRGYDIFAADTLGSHLDSGVHFTPALLHKAPCLVGRKPFCSTGLSCASVEAAERSQYAVWSGRDYQKEINSVLRIPDTLPIQMAGKIGGKGVSMQQINQLFLAGNGIIDTVQLNASNEVSLNYRDMDQILDPHFLSAICELPTVYDPTRYVSFLKEFGTHIMVKLRYGSVAVTRSVIPQILILEQIQSNGSAQTVTPEVLQTAMETARKLGSVDIITNSFSTPNRPIMITLRNISYFVTKPRIVASNPPTECSGVLNNDSAISSLQSNLNQAMSDYSKETDVTERSYPVIIPAISTSSSSTPTPQSRMLVIPNESSTQLRTKPPKRTPPPRRSTPSTRTTAAAILPTTTMTYVVDGPSGLWPAGTYALLEAADGCPAGDWRKGSRFQDSEDRNNRNDWAVLLTSLTTSRFSPEGVRLHFCVKTTPFSPYEPDWPPGQYCLFKKGPCPIGFETSFVDHDDETTNNGNGQEGVLPDGFYTHNTRYYFCCRDDGDVDIPISLPKSRPFFLLRKGQQCQRVWDMDAEPLWLFTDCEDSSAGCRMSPYGHHPGLTSVHGDWQWHFCHYTPAKRR
ncbi:uncharacterized protein LOC129599100 isoform X2 [Paramacrobiotus metropolitanus]|uniref:uncharacterized protein LOC129599100 isoform X2 n=1 Tax=Paramacrobiotus metropolitanus TaxID=2943436 RepID=UPI002445DF91|nr:uncharacterized protein LOC129599100 isoform X2 [Paramacrobiotus metropolitanus]